MPNNIKLRYDCSLESLPLVPYYFITTIFINYQQGDENLFFHFPSYCNEDNLIQFIIFL